ncbi:hypothetical protein QQZ08_001314 [Neonectria magnoliae]|uniref:Heterokaryon incompatibility domain-containing protein n=1 Tax=Neonectria magnoliae TaxID=2732573 RepID=A0ABR1IEN2_9HYPO
MLLRTTLGVKTGENKWTLDHQPFVNYAKAPQMPVLVDHAKVNYEPLRKWCEMVQHIAREEMLVLPVSVIDCHKREVVLVRGPCDYAALSYVWGPAVAQGAPSKGKSLPTLLPRTVEDAITVVKELGLRYLWIDRYCLDQSNKAEFKAQLDQMADIYRHALVTIIGAAGSDADYGLPGVSSRARIKQPRVKVGDYTLWSSMTDPRKLVRGSTWMTRAWTHQEGVFSWNWFAFTDEQVFFQRSNKEWANLERWWKVSSEMFPHGGLGPDSNCPLLRMYDNVWKNEGAVHGMLGQYTARNLSYQTDALNGILGLLKRCENGPYRMNHYFGVPVLGPLINHRKAYGRDPSRSWTLTEAFLVNLCWRTQGVGPRRLGFPSWSWTGWRAIYESPPHVMTHMGLSVENLINVRLFVQTKQGLVEWEDMCNTTAWDVYMDLSTFSQELYVQAPTVALTIGYNIGAPAEITHGHAADFDVPKGWCAMLSDEECVVFIEVNMVDATIQSTGSVSLKGLLLRQVDSTPEKIVFITLCKKMSITRIDIDSDGDTLIILPYEGVPGDDGTQKAADDAATTLQDDSTPEASSSDENAVDPLPQLHLKVSMKHLALASRRAKAMFNGPFKEAQPSAVDGLRHWEFEPIFDPDAFQIVMNVIHGKTRQTPMEMELKQLADFAAVVDDLECHDAVWFVARIWVGQLSKSGYATGIANIARVILVSSVFNEERLFQTSTSQAILQGTNSLSTYGLPIRPKIVG